MEFVGQSIHSPFELKILANQLRLDTLEMVHCAGSGHLGGSFSAAEIITCLYFNHLKIDPSQPLLPERDRFILSKGHAAPVLYAALARRGFFPIEELSTFRHLGSRLQGHPDRLKIPGVDMSTGSLGHGLPIGVGLALALRRDYPQTCVYVLVGDGECQAGVLWEGVQTASKYGLSNLIVIVDKNNVQLDGPVQKIMPIAPFREKWLAFNWNVLETEGHDPGAILESLHQANEQKERPSVIIANTVKGKGVSFMENQSSWHGRAPNEAEYTQALIELQGVVSE